MHIARYSVTGQRLPLYFLLKMASLHQIAGFYGYCMNIISSFVHSEVIKLIKYLCGCLATILKQLVLEYFIFASSFTPHIFARISTYIIIASLYHI